MGILLATSQNLIDVAVDGIGTIELKWIGYVISWIFNLFKDVPVGVALGAVLFTLALKTLVLPLDIYSRVKMKKQALMMESMRPQMEKLQKQYANDKNMYNQKVAELQRANGFNPLSACLPTIISLVIFMFVFSSFSQYSQYSNLTAYNNMTKAYSNAVQTYVLTEEVDQTAAEYFLIAAEEDGLNGASPIIPKTVDGKLVKTDGSGNTVEVDVYGYFVDYGKFEEYYTQTVGSLPEGWQDMPEAEKNLFVSDYVRLGAREAAADYYRANKQYNSFPAPNWWVGNVWYPDSMFNKEVPSFEDFRKAISRAAGSIDANYEESYNEVTYNLQEEKDTYNGYFVLIVLAIGLMFLQQFITMRSQKATSELGSVDGSGAATNKMMMIIMPIIFGLISFMYSAAFSIYMITNTLYSLISTLIINKAVSVRFDKNSQKQAAKKESMRAGRKRLK